MSQRILVIIGTRPEAIKLAPVVRALAASPGVECRVLVTGQHRDLVRPALAIFGITPDIDLGIRLDGRSLSASVGTLLAALEPAIAAEDPTWVIVQGDTISALAGAMAAHLLDVPVAHVEAGLRTGDRSAPFPEETSRRLIADLATVHFAPTAAARSALLAEGIADDDIVVSGNTIVDAMRYARLAPFDPATAGLDGIASANQAVVLVTAHRRENHGAPIASLCEAVRSLVAMRPDLRVVWPVHPHPDVDGPVRAALADLSRVTLLPPLDYRAFLWLFEQAIVIVTDSGGVQEEAVAFGRPVIVMRQRTERAELVAAGLATLVLPDATAIRTAVLAAVSERTRRIPDNPFGDGHAAGRVRDRLCGVASRVDPTTLFRPFPVPQPNPIFVPDRRRVLIVAGDTVDDLGPLETGDALEPVVLLRPGAPTPGSKRPDRAEFLHRGIPCVTRPDVVSHGSGVRARLMPYGDAILREIVRQRARAVVAVGRPDIAVATVIAARWAGIPAVVLDGPGWADEAEPRDAIDAGRAHQVAEDTADLVSPIGPRERIPLTDLVARAERALADVFADGKKAARPLADHTIALIADPFTASVFGPEAQVVPLSSRTWREAVADRRFDALVIESTWYGPDKSWQGLVYRRKGARSALDEVIAHFRDAGIPVLYWGKEDPPHLTGFVGTAIEADIVFTTDANSIRTYLGIGDLRASVVASLPFAAQPALHHPLPPARPWDPTIAFGGTWWQGIYPARAAFLRSILELALPLGLAIYDRNFQGGKSSRAFPDSVIGAVRGGLEYAEMVEAYRSHPVHLNVNSVDSSPTMFARRAFEVAACGTAGLSGPGRGVTEVLGDAVPVVEKAEDALPILTRWISDPASRIEDARRAMRAVYRAHLAGHRLAFMLRVAGLTVLSPALPAYALRCDRVDASAAAAILAQTVLPAAVVSADPAAAAALPGVRVVAPGDALGEEIGLVGWLDRFSVAEVAPEHYEDLLTTRWYDGSDAVGMVDGGEDDPPRLVMPGALIDPFGGLVRGTLATLADDPPVASVLGLGVRRPAGAR